MCTAERWSLLAFTLLALAAPVATALDYQVHGSLAQGFVLSEGNNFYGPSTDGSFQFYEVALNGTVKPLSKLLLSAQVVARDAGATDDGKPRLDYAFADYAFLKERGGEVGLRAGRVKNAFGLFNDSRDVVFTRPGILMPSTYFESSGARALLFSSNGFQPYGAVTLGEHYLSAAATWAPNSTLDHRQADRLNLQGDVRLEDFYMGRVQDEWGRWTAAASYLHGSLQFQFPPGVNDDLGFQVYVLSSRYNAERFSLTGEYALTAADGTFGSASFQSKSDAGYLQGEYFLDPQWTLLARWDSSFADRNDRHGTNPGSTCATNTATFVTDPHNCYAHDFTVGANWKSPVHWGVWGEYHLIDGLYSASARDNTPPAPNDAHWSMFLLMGAYRF